MQKCEKKITLLTKIKIYHFFNFAQNSAMQYFNKILNSVIAVANKVGSFQLDSSSKLKKSDIESKGLNDFVSFVDKQSESMLIDELSEIIPNSSFLAEEGGKIYTESEWMWIVDPLMAH